MRLPRGAGDPLNGTETLIGTRYVSTVSESIGSIGFSAASFITLGLTAPIGLYYGLHAVWRATRGSTTVWDRLLAAVSALIGLVVVCGAVNVWGHVFWSAREKARDVSCMNNLKTLGKALLQYSQDHDNLLPPAGRWGDCLLPYVGGKTDSYVCPEMSRAPSGYAYNRALDLRKVDEFDLPAQTPSLFDARGGLWNEVGGPGLVDFRHVNRAILAFVDGHVQSWTADQVRRMNQPSEGAFDWEPKPPIGESRSQH